MNPWAFFLIILGILVIIVGVKGNLPDILNELKGVSSTTRQASGVPLPPTAKSPTKTHSPAKLSEATVA